MHFTKPALVVASFLWATTFASPIDSPAILRTRGLIGDITSNDNTKDIAGSTTAGNTVGDDSTKSVSKGNTVEDATGSLNLDDVTGGLTAREASKHHHSHENEAGDIVEGAVGDVGDDVGDATRDNAMGDDANGVAENAVQAHNLGLSRGGAVHDTTGDDANDAKSNSGSTGALLGRVVVRDNDGSVHDANKAVHDANKAAIHDANKAVHDANKVVHNTLHGLLSGILR